MRFSERHGFVEPREALQIGRLDKPTRNRLINYAIVSYLKHSVAFYLTDDARFTFARLIDEFFKSSIDLATDNGDVASKMLIKWANDCDWYSLLDLLEFLAQLDREEKKGLGRRGKRFAAGCNQIFESEKVGYRFVREQVVPIVAENELATVEEALDSEDEFSGVRTHISRALELYSDRRNPDYRNAIKEAISAVESACKVISKKERATLTDALKVIEVKHNVHPALREALIKLYGYTSDKQGIRHALIEDTVVDHAEAKLMLVGCSAFCNYLVERYGGE
jgi:hypothetical protein